MRRLLNGHSWGFVASVVLVACSGQLVLDHRPDASTGAGNDGGPSDTRDASSPGAGGWSPLLGGGGSGNVAVMPPAGAPGAGGNDSTPGMGGAGGTIVYGGAAGTLIACPGHSLSELSAGGSPWGGGGTGAVGGVPVAADAGTLWPGNGTDCPSTVPDIASSCNVSMGRICAYNAPFNAPPEQSGWFVCVPKDLKSTVWDKFDYHNDGEGCPDVPSPGAPCAVEPSPEAGPAPSTCGYPGSYCVCSVGIWACFEVGSPIPVPQTFPFSSKRIRDLTDDERRQWCEWRACDTSHVVLTELPPTTDIVHFNSCSWSPDPALNAYVSPEVSLSVCQANLSISQCEALVSELTDCAVSFRTSVPSPRGCGPYLAKPGCSGTVFSRLDEYTGAQGGAGPGGSITPLDCTLKIR